MPGMPSNVGKVPQPSSLEPLPFLHPYWAIGSALPVHSPSYVVHAEAVIYCSHSPSIDVGHVHPGERARTDILSETVELPFWGVIMKLFSSFKKDQVTVQTS